MRLHGSGRHDDCRRKWKIHARNIVNRDAHTPTPTYTTVPGRNYLEVITAATNAQAWNIAYLGSTPAHNHTLNPTNTSDKYTTAAALYVFYNSDPTAQAFDTWNFNTIASWASVLQSAPLTQETTLLNDIVTAQTNNTPLYPSKDSAKWVPAGTVVNATIKADLDNVKTAAAAAGMTMRLPQQCVTGQPCTAPTP